ncbi:MAG: hypothetical protein V3U88_00410 [Methylococcales bacterium]
MKNRIMQISQAEQANPCLPVEAENQHPLRQAICQVLRETTHAKIMPLVALSLAGLASPSLAQQARVDVANLDGSNGFMFVPVNAYDGTGGSVSAAGDINGDGIDDLLIGAENASPNGYLSGASYVVFGTSEVGGNGTMELSALNGTNGFVLNGVTGGDETEQEVGDRAGSSVSAAGDINGDGIDDLVIGAFSANGFDGASYVVFGSDQGFTASIELSDLNGNNGFVLNGDYSTGRSGISVSGAGDINGDGVDDLLIGADDANTAGVRSTGASYVVFGGNEVGSNGTLDLSILDGNNGFVLNGVGGQTGRSVSVAGDVNGDGVDDLLIGAAGFNASFVMFGADSVGASGMLDLSRLDGNDGFVINGAVDGDGLGNSVSGAGDVNGDGIDDLLIGASRADPNGRNSGASYIVFGASDVGAGGTLELSAFDGSNGFVLNGVIERTYSGGTVSAAGDVNGDGIDDLLIGAGRNSFVVFGGRGIGSNGTQELSNLNGGNGFGINVSGVGVSSVSGVGDVNADGVDDIMIGRYVVFGQKTDDRLQATLDVQVSASNDDAEENVANDKVKPGSSDLEFGDQGGKNQLVGMRFNDLGIPQGATITNAFIQFQVDETHSGASTLMIEGQATDNALTFARTNGNISSRNRTNAVVDWQPIPWTTVGEAGSDQQTPNIASVIQEIVGRPGWSSDNSLAIIITGNGRRVAESFNGDAAGAPVLHVEYRLINQAPAVDAGPGQTITLPLNEVNLDGTVSDDGLPAPDELVTTWSKVNGPGTVIFADTNAVDTTTSFDTEGTYVLRLTADDGSQSVFDELTVIVNAAGTPISGQPALFELSSLNGDNGFVLNGKSRDDYSGFSVNSAGDLNGDGIDDFVIGSKVDETYVVFGGGRVGSRGIVELSELDGSNGFVLNGVAAGDFSENFSYNSGNQVSAAGDVNGDGIDDLLIGASGRGSRGSTTGVNGASYVVFGASGIGNNGAMELSALDGQDGFILNGIAAGTGDFAGYSVSAAGDINSDGIDDLLIGASGVDLNGNENIGASYVVFGASEVGTSGTLELSDLNGSNGFVLNGVAEGDISGFSVSGAGDVNGDGVDDLLIGAPGSHASGNRSSTNYVVFGGDAVGSSGTFELSALDGSNGFVLNGVTAQNVVSAQDRAGVSVSTAGDINGDGIDDLLIGANEAKPNGFASGASYVVFGANEVGVSGSLELSTLNGSNGFVINGVLAGDNSGTSVGTAGDVNGDGVDDLLIGAPEAFCTLDEDGAECFYQGASYVVFGASGVGANGTVELSMLDGNNGFQLKGATSSGYSGSSVSTAGDVNNDGISDLLIGAPRDSISGVVSGASYVVFGQVFDSPVSVPVQTTLDIPVSASNDDAEENIATGKVKPGSSDLEFGDQDKKNQLVGIRFNGLNIPQGATITNASIQFQVDEANSGTTTLMIEGQATDNALMFTRTNDNISSRDRTNAVIDWQPAPWTRVGEAGADQQTPDLTSIIQEIVDRPGWSSGNSLAIIITGSGRRAAESFDGDAAPLLHVVYQ